MYFALLSFSHALLIHLFSGRFAFQRLGLVHWDDPEGWYGEGGGGGGFSMGNTCMPVADSC